MLEALANALVTAYKRHAERGRGSAGRDRHRDRRHQGDRAGARRRGPGRPRVGRHARSDFGRIAAQTAKQVILQRIREAEREMQVRGVRGPRGRHRHRHHPADRRALHAARPGRVEALLPQAEQVQNERYEHGSRLKAYIVEVRKTAKGPQIVVSRTHPGLVKRLFELEVPELAGRRRRAQGRRPRAGSPHEDRGRVERLATSTRSARASVPRGLRVRQVVNELRGEKVDIVPFIDDASEFVMKALAPAQGARGPHPPGHRHRRGDRPRLPALARDRQGRPERAPRAAAHRLARRHQERDPARGGRVGRRRRVRRGRVGHQRPGELVWQPAEGGEAISAAEAGYAAPEPPADGEAERRRAATGEPAGEARSATPAARRAAAAAEAAATAKPSRRSRRRPADRRPRQPVVAGAPSRAPARWRRRRPTEAADGVGTRAAHLHRVRAHGAGRGARPHRRRRRRGWRVGQRGRAGRVALCGAPASASTRRMRRKALRPGVCRAAIAGRRNRSDCVRDW